ncbi:hypothetical protein GLOTRDRAFT_135580 [Gloeophyllum trabeum ATCC 11539]|uniref:Carbohydrate-binding module family 19 domain-containing protein n=1 Tax=Gloeophyllum trabeum (strain ATCC 11539 / FP-39264 / Madison 617) TaxID=670483 RepID=S7S509_GLOTA|nr:uncharacterized protein GLOTRDRAFT_135580 [Gloeophyllum trabeum ATCC 11539]EPQ61004.1 hypothetical protein GLOTRDRAFT_135580 [Gloeophyllum trabeum ATCC 11539]
MKYSAVLAIAFALSASVADARPMRRAASAQDTKNGQDAAALNAQFKSMTVGQACTTGQNACINGAFAQCANGKMVSLGCAPGTTCAAVPITGGPGTLVMCTTQADIDARFAAAGVSNTGAAASGAAASSSAATGATASSSAVAASSSAAAGTKATSSAAAASSVAASATSSAAAAASSSAANNAGGAAAGNNNSTDPQSSLTLLDSVIAKGFENDGQSQPEAGQVASKTSSNNFINFCATVPNLPITNGQQIKAGSCNPAPMGVIASTANMPSSKFVFPTNMGTVPANKAFTIQMAISHLDTGFFVNANENYFAAPQFTNAAGDVQGHSHVVIEQLTSLNQTEPTDPTKFAFFKGLNAAAQNGILTADVPAPGLPAGAYRLASINSAANHQPVLVAVAQHGSLDDMVYFTVQ